MLDAETLLGLDSVISSFYDAALGQVSWEEPLRLAAEIMQVTNAIFSVRDPITRQANFSFGNFGANDDYKRSFAQKYAVLSPFVVSTAVGAIGAAVNPIELIGRDIYEKGVFFKEWSQPQRYHDYIGSVLIRQPRAIYTLAFGRKDDEPLFSQVDHAKLEFLTPHVIRALTLSGQLNTLKMEKAELLSTIDSLAAPIVLVDRSRNVRQINKSALELVKAGSILMNDGGKLRFGEDKLNDEFQNAFLKQDSNAVCLDSQTMAGLRVHLLPQQLLRNGTAAKISDERMLIVLDHAPASMIPIGTHLKDRFGLTISELRVLIRLIDGGTVNSIASDFGLSRNTIKTHVSHLFQKTGTNRHAELIRLIQMQSAALSPIVPHVTAIAAPVLEERA